MYLAYRAPPRPGSSSPRQVAATDYSNSKLNSETNSENNSSSNLPANASYPNNSANAPIIDESSPQQRNVNSPGSPYGEVPDVVDTQD